MLKFLNGKLHVFIMQPPSDEESDPQKYCFKHYKSIYELKQAGCKWYEIVCHTLADLGFKKCEANPAVLDIYIYSGKHMLILAIHVYHCTVIALSHALVQQYKLKIKSKYVAADALTDLGAIN